MHITATCPACQSQYQVDPNLRGKRMRCPNPICRTVFEVTDGSPVAVAAPPVAEPTKPKWAAPPPVRAAASPLTPPSRVDDFDIPGDDDVGRVSDPSLSEPSGKGILDRAAPGRVGDPSHHNGAASRTRSRRPLLLVAAAVILVGIVAVVVVRQRATQKQMAEAGLAAKAQEIYQAGDFGESTKRYQQLQRDYPDSPALADYRFMATLSELRAEVDAANDPLALADARKHAGEFLDSYQETAALSAHQREAFESVLQLVKRSLRSLDENPDTPALAATQTIWDRARPLAGRATDQEHGEFERAFAAMRERIALDALRNRLLATVDRSPPTAAAIAEARAQIVAGKLKDDPAIADAVKKLRDRHKASIAFVPPGAPARTVLADNFEVIPLTASLQSSKPGPNGDPIVALSPAGVLYGVHPKKGDLAWAMRLGIDSRAFPLPIANRADAPPGFVAVSNDLKFLALVDVTTGRLIWRHDLAASVAVTPFVAAGRLLIPLVTGRVEVLDPATGRLDGSYQLDQPLAAEGASHPGTSLVSLPGAAHCVYVLDLLNHSCVAILDTDHPAGSLVGPPIVVPAGEKRWWLILTQAEPGPRVRLRPIAFSLGEGRSRPEQELVLSGTLSGAPRHDAESILLATEEGKLHRIGLRLPGNANDPLLFKLTPGEIVLDSPGRGQPLRALVGHADADNIWVMSGGRLHRLQESFSAKTGPIVKSRWPLPPALGEPLHVPQVRAEGDETTLFLTTHDPLGSATLLSAVDGETGKILWQTQLGSIPRGEPVEIRDHVAWDDGAVLFFGKGAAPKPAFTAIPHHGEPRNAVLFGDVKTPKTRLRVSWRADQSKLTLHDFEAFSETPPPREVKLPAPVAGAPIQLGDALIVPLKSGTLVRVDLDSLTTTSGPTWRTPGGDDKPPDLVALPPDRFVVSKGTGLAAFEWGKTWKEVAHYQPTDRVLAGPPVLLPDGKLLVAEAAGSLLLLDGDRLQPIGRKDWALKGKITAGPFVVGANVVMAVDGKRLVALDPARDGILWEVALQSDVAVAPRLVGQRLIVADVRGNFWTLDPTTGANLAAEDRPALSVRANIAPDVSPIPLPDGRLLVIWSDGTAGIVAVP